MTSDISVLIQGPLSETSLDNLEYYKSIGPVVISTWQEYDCSLLDKYNLDGCEVVLRPVPRNKSYFREDTFDYQINSIYNGLVEIKTPYVIRTRSDEYWGNLAPLIDKFNNSECVKIVCGNIFFKRWGVFHYHVGDHLFIGNTNILTPAYYDLINRPSAYANMYCAEVSLAISIMQIYGAEITRENFVKIFDVVDINDLKPFRASFRHAGITYDNFFTDDSILRTMEEL